MPEPHRFLVLGEELGTGYVAHRRVHAIHALGNSVKRQPAARTLPPMTMRNVHPVEEQKRVAVGTLEGYRLAGIVEAIEKSRGVSTISTSLN